MKNFDAFSLEGYTFDDVMLIPQKSEIIPKDVIVKTKLAKKIFLNVPIVSAAMDTVTETAMAITMARLGGLGFIHKNMTAEQQAKMVKRVKLSQSGMITEPITLEKDQLIKDALSLMSYYRISGLPVIEKDGKLIGIVTNRDLKYREDFDTPVKDVMTKKNLITAPVGTNLEEAKNILMTHRIEKLPIVDNNYRLRGLITIKDIDKVKDYPQTAKDENGRLLCGAAVGITDDIMERVKALVLAGVDIITVDSAHGHSRGVIEAIKSIKSNYPELPLVGGNIVTKEAAADLINAGADCLKVGIGPGSICTTRVIAGVGVPQITAVNEVYKIAKAYNIPIISDGGIKYSGDIVKAIAAGADVVMLGSLLAGTEETPGDEIIYNGRRYKIYQGMGSIAAMRRGGQDRYFQKHTDEPKKLVPEGIEARVPYAGNLEDVIYQLVGGIKAGMGYCGTETIPQLKENGRFIRITKAGQIESHPHNVELTASAPNYR